MTKVVLASHNQGKLKEIKAILADLTDLELVGAAEVSPAVATLDPEETGTTFAQNAEIKARAFAAATGLPALADDSGVCVTALDDFPGVHSARWLPGTDQDRLLGLLDKLQNELQATGSTDRSARYVACFCYYDPASDSAHFFTGECYGWLAPEPRGDHGFGYDPAFIPDLSSLKDQALAQKLAGQTFGELPIEVKNELSHRARALEKFREFWLAQKSA